MPEAREITRRSFFLVADHHRLSAEYIKPANDSSNDQRPTLVFLHEGLGSIGQWRDFPLLLGRATGLPALIYDRWGHGKSDPLRNPRNVGYMHDEALTTLPEILNQLRMEKTILIGHSDGGSIALLFAAEYPERVSGIVTAAAHVFVEDITIKGIREAVRVFETTNLRERLRPYHGDNTESMFRGWADIWLAPEFRDWNIEAYLPAVTSPVLAIQGINDEYGTAAQVDAIVRQVSGPVQGLLIPDCGHIPHHQARERVLSEIIRFIPSLKI
jgi:pimeloyl-ACP methyl ester carboxylesterase